MMLETERLILRPYQEGDLYDYFKILSDRKNMYYLDDVVTNTLVEAQLSLQETIDLMISGDARRFAVTLKGKSCVIGGIGYEITANTPIGRIGHIGWFLLPEYQNLGYITEAAKRVLAYAFDDDNCVRITTGCYKENVPTQKVIAKVGFRQEAERTKAQWHDGKMKDRLEYAINKEDWEIQKEIMYYNSLPVHFDLFMDLPMLSDGEIYLVCIEKYVGPPEKKHVPAYNFAVCKNGEKIGSIGLRIGYGGGLKGDNLYYGGHIGYGIDEKHRGSGYAVRACQLLLPIAKAHGMIKLLITNDVSNNASRRVCEKLGARFLRKARLPEWNDLYKEGQRFSNIFEWRFC